MDLQSGDFLMADACGAAMRSAQRLRPVFVLYRGKQIVPSSDYLPFWERQAA
jgi:hypothetical protein